MIQILHVTTGFKSVADGLLWEQKAAGASPATPTMTKLVKTQESIEWVLNSVKLEDEAGGFPSITGQMKMIKAKTLAEEYRIKLGLKPWNEFEAEVLERWTKDSNLTETARNRQLKEKRQTGKTTRQLLLAIAEATVRKRPLVISGAGETHTDVMFRIAKKFVEQLNANVTVIRNSAMVAFTDSDFPR